MDDSRYDVLGTTQQPTFGLDTFRDLELDATGNGIALFANSHEHDVTATTRGGETTYTLSGPLDIMRARVPYYGKLDFERNGVPIQRGVSVGSGRPSLFAKYVSIACFAMYAASDPCAPCSAKTTPAISGLSRGAKKTKKP